MIQTICVCGAGTMGAGIAEAAAQHHIPTILYDLDSNRVLEAEAAIERDLDKLVEKSKISHEEKNKIRRYLRFTNSINDCIADIIIEAIAENANAKTGLFNQLAEINHSDTIFASNTSSLSISSIAEKVMHPERVAGMHFFNPATVMKLVEVVKGERTGDTVIDHVMSLAKRMGKTAVLCRDAPGFIVNHVARPYYLEALRMVESGLADYATIDRLMEASGFKLGPFRLMDLIGNDINYTVSCSVFEQMGKPERLKPSALQEEKVKTGQLGRKTGKGYYEYGENA